MTMAHHYFSGSILTAMNKISFQQVCHMSVKQDLLKVITIPYSIEQKSNNVKRQNKNENRIKTSTKEKKNDRPVITAKNSKLNHYVGQVYTKFENITLVSKGWLNKKSVGDFFTINSFKDNPSTLSKNDEESTTFEELGIDSELVKALKKKEIFTPTNIQVKAIPEILKGSNVLVSSETGNGKTLAFLVPIIQKIIEHTKNIPEVPNNSPYAIICTPSRELAIQIKRIAEQMVNESELHVRLAIGGSMKRKMLHTSVKKVHILIGSFGAISKLTTTRVYKLNHLRHLVLDECDTLLDDSFQSQVLHFMKKFPINSEQSNDNNTTGAQIVLVGATIPKSLKHTFSSMLDVETLKNIQTSYLHKVQPHVEQKFLRVNSHNKVEKFLQLIKNCHRNNIPTVIFSNKSETSDWISLFLNENEIPCVNLNGGMSLRIRYGKFDSFQRGEFNFISCTDISSRGLDTVRVRHVVNYDFPKYVADYIHRCGRTGRIGSSSKTFVTNFVKTQSDVVLTQEIELASRKNINYLNVDANIKKIITDKTKMYEIKQSME